jgi:hypothetical protein
MNKNTLSNSKDFLSDILGEKQVNLILIFGGGLAVLYVFGIVCKVLTHTVVNYKTLQNVLQA